MLITASTFPRWKGDTEPRFVLDFAKAVSKKYKVTVLTPWTEGSSESEILEGIKVIRYHYFPFKKWETLCYPGAILARIRQKKVRILLVPFFVLSLVVNIIRYQKDCDIVVANWLIPQGIIQSFFKKPYLLICHGSDVMAMNKGIIRTLKQNALRKASAIATVSNELKRQIKQNFSVSNVTVLPMGVYAADFYMRQSKMPCEGCKTVLFVGRLEKIKGVKYLIDAMKEINAKLIIVGDGSLRKELEKQAFNQERKIMFYGAVNHSQLPDIYASADVFVAPSITLENGSTEGFGLVLIEAMAAGIPVIGTRTGGIQDIIQDGKNGYLVEEKNSQEIAERVNQLLSNRQLHETISVNALNTALKYDWEKIGDLYLQLIEKYIEFSDITG